MLHVTCDASCVRGSYLWHLGAHRLHFRQHHRAPADSQKNSLSHLLRLWAEMSQMDEQRAADNPHSITRHNDEFKLLFRWFPPILTSSHSHNHQPIALPTVPGWVGHWREKLGRGRSGDKITDHTYTRSVNMEIRNILLKLSFRILWQDTIINKIVYTTTHHSMASWSCRMSTCF